MKKYPFKFLDAYTKADKAIFFGREEEVDELYRMTFQANLMLVYGASGTGKTSLIRCGLANRFKPSQWLDLYIRRGADINRSLLDTVVKHTPEKVEVKVEAEVEAEEEGTDAWFESLMEEEQAGKSEAEATPTFKTDNPVARALQALYLATFTPIYLIFDQFEELYTLGKPEEQRKLTETIEELVQLPLPLKVIIVMREEYLARLYELEKAVPQLRNKKLRIEPMGLPQVEGVILSATARNPASNIELEAGKEAVIARAIIEKVREQDVNVKLPYLQVYMDRLYEQATGEEVGREQEALFSLELVNQMGDIGDVLADFIERQSQRIYRKLAQDFGNLPPDIAWQILSPFATVDGTKIPIRQEKLAALPQNLKLPGLRDAGGLMKAAVAELENSRILRYRKEEGAYELAHDSLALQVAEKRSEEEKAYLKARRLVTEGYATFQDTRTWLSREQLAFIRPYEERLKGELEESHWAFLAESRKKRRRQQVLLWTGVAAAFVVALLVILYVLDQQRTTADALEIAKNREAAALAAEQARAKALEISRENEAKAVAAQEKADSNAQLAQRKTGELEESFRNLRLTNVRVVQLLLQKARKDASEQRYDDAVSAINSADQLQVLPDSVAQTCFSLAREAMDAVQLKGAWSLASTAYRLGIPREEISKTCLELSDMAILNLDYETANAAIHLAAKIGLAPEKSAEIYLELAYFYAETRRFQAGWARLDSASRIGGWPRLGSLAPGGADTLGWLRQRLERANPGRYGFLEKRYYPEMVKVEGGAFMMGCDSVKLRETYGEDRGCLENELPRHEVKVSNFYISKYETTWWQYYLFCQATGYDCRESRWDNSGNNPVIYANWFDAVEYANWVSQQEGLEEAIYLDVDSVYQVKPRSSGYRLPTEAEWEYAARGGQQSKGYLYSGGDEVGEVAWYYDNASSRTQPFGQKKANELGLHDMSGNVWEWCWDWYDEDYYINGLREDPRGPDTGSCRVLRGGSWDFITVILRSSYRHWFYPDYWFNYFGFRLAQGY